MNVAETGYIYVIGMPCVQAVKVGYAADVDARLSGLQTGSPFPLLVLFRREVRSAPAVEFALHQRFSDKRVRGEWFDLGPDAARLVGEACDEITAELPAKAVSGAAEKELGYDPYCLAPHELVWKDAGRWFDSLTEQPEHVTVEELAGHIRTVTEDELWGKLSDYRTCWLIREAYSHDQVTAPPELQIDGDRIPAGLIRGIWEHLKRQATWQPRWAPHCGVPVEAAEAEAARLRAAVEERKRAGVCR